MNRWTIVAAAAVLLAACQPSASPVPPTPAAAGPTATPATTGPSSSEPDVSARPDVTAPPSGALRYTVQTFPVPNGAHPHDVAVASDGGIWYTGQRNGTMGWLNPETG